jgi:hypothetical protein
MFLRNQGVVCCGRSIEEAWLMTYHTENTQMLTL